MALGHRVLSAAGPASNASAPTPARAGTLAAVCLLAAHLAFSVGPALGPAPSDFANYYVPARAAWTGQDLSRAYERTWFQTQAARAGVDDLGSFVPHPPANALLLLPLAGLGAPTAKAIWSVVLAACGVAAFFVLRPLVAVPGWLLALAFLLPSASWTNALAYGQPYPLLLLLLCLALRASVAGRGALAGLALAPVLVLKLYAAPFLLRFVWQRRGREVLGLVAGAAAVTLVSLLALGPGLHERYLSEVLPASLRGEIQDPYSPVWGSASSLARRLLAREPDLNPVPVADRPGLARALARGAATAVVLVAVLARACEPGREWAALVLAGLLASPLTATYHFVLLILPVALLLPSYGSWGRSALLAALAFATSSAPHFFARFAQGWGNLLAYPRLWTVLALLVVAVRPPLGARRVALALAVAAAAGVSAARSAEEPWTRVEEARGYLLAEPAPCAGGLAWTTIAGGRLVVRAPDGRLLGETGHTLGARCRDGERLEVLRVQPGRMQGRSIGGEPPGCGPRTDVPADAPREDVDFWGCAGPVVFADRASRTLREAGASPRVLARGLVRRPRLSPDLAWVVYEAWEAGSWDLRVVERASGRVVSLTRDPANEVEPAWTRDGRRVVFASDRRRGQGATALYVVPFAP